MLPEKAGAQHSLSPVKCLGGGSGDSASLRLCGVQMRVNSARVPGGGAGVFREEHRAPIPRGRFSH